MLYPNLSGWLIGMESFANTARRFNLLTDAVLLRSEIIEKDPKISRDSGDDLLEKMFEIFARRNTLKFLAGGGEISMVHNRRAPGKRGIIVACNS